MEGALQTSVYDSAQFDQLDPDSILIHVHFWNEDTRRLDDSNLLMLTKRLSSSIRVFSFNLHEGKCGYKGFTSLLIRKFAPVKK